MENLKYMVCPEGHAVPYDRYNFAKDFSDEKIDADFMPMFEVGLYCYQCNRPYGLSKLKDPETK